MGEKIKKMCWVYTPDRHLALRQKEILGFDTTQMHGIRQKTEIAWPHLLWSIKQSYGAREEECSLEHR